MLRGVTYKQLFRPGTLRCSLGVNVEKNRSRLVLKVLPETVDDGPSQASLKNVWLQDMVKNFSRI